MTSEKTIKRIRKLKQENRDLVCELRRHLEENLYNFCETLGGHFFWDWQEEVVYMLFGTKTYKRRRCWACDKVEEILIKEDFPISED
jgi:hypothetical protein